MFVFGKCLWLHVSAIVRLSSAGMRQRYSGAFLQARGGLVASLYVISDFGSRSDSSRFPFGE